MQGSIFLPLSHVELKAVMSKFRTKIALAPARRFFRFSKAWSIILDGGLFMNLLLTSIWKKAQTGWCFLTTG